MVKREGDCIHKLCHEDNTNTIATMATLTTTKGLQLIRKDPTATSNSYNVPSFKATHD